MLRTTCAEEANMSAVGSKWRVTRRAVLTPIAAVAIFAGSSLAAVVAAPGSALAATSTLSLGNAGTTVKTSNGASWTLVVSWDQVISTEAPNLSVALERVVGGTGYEFHDWIVPVTASTLTFNKKTGTLNVGAQASPIATVDLSFKTTSSKKATCTTGSETVYSGTLSGKVTLVTGLTGGGTVGGSLLSFKAATPEITVDSSCIPPEGNECTADVLFSSGNFTGTTPAASGGSLSLFGKSFNEVGLTRSTDLTAPAGAIRSDVAAQEGLTPKYDAKTKVLTVTASKSGLVTGSATLKGGKVKTASYTCKYSKKSYKVTDRTDSSATYSSPAGHPISAKTSLAGPMTAPSSTKTGFYIVSTVKAL
jgi:hypothetical protein